MKLRVRFSKTGNLRFVGHLDLMRSVQKAIRRAGIDAAYSAGFSPHMILSFAEALGLGLTSTGEYFDLEVTYADPFADESGKRCPSSQWLTERLNAEFPEDLKVQSVRRISPLRRDNAMAQVASADYAVMIPVPEDQLAEFPSPEAFLAQPEILIEKETKSGPKTVDIRPMIRSLSVSNQAPDTGRILPEHYLVLQARTDCGSQRNLKIEHLVPAYLAFAGQSVPLSEIQLHRNELYLLQEDTLLPLMDAGEEIP